MARQAVTAPCIALVGLAAGVAAINGPAWIAIVVAAGWLACWKAERFGYFMAVPGVALVGCFAATAIDSDALINVFGQVLFYSLAGALAAAFLEGDRES